MAIALLEAQRRLRREGKIRLGCKGTKGEPKKLEKFRLTSANRAIIEEAAKRYGGKCQPWETEWEVYTEASELPVLVAPMEIDQWYEDWTGGLCVHRCDGMNDSITGRPCGCDPDNRTCKLTTRLSLWLPELSTFSVWMLESHGYYAAVELPGYHALLRQAMDANRPIPATLAIEQRERRTRQANGQPITRKFVVPVLRPKASIVQVLGLSDDSPPTPAAVEPMPAAIEPPRPALAAASCTCNAPQGKPHLRGCPLADTGEPDERAMLLATLRGAYPGKSDGLLSVIVAELAATSKRGLDAYSVEELRAALVEHNRRADATA